MFTHACNPHVTNFLCYIDHAWQNNRLLFHHQCSHTCKEEPCIPHPNQQESWISECLLQSCPLDWFDPKYFNSIDVEFWVLYIDAPIALPLVEHCSLLINIIANPPDWKDMSEEKFMETYGNAVWAQYNLLTKEELNVLNGVEDLDPEGPVYQDDNVESEWMTNQVGDNYALSFHVSPHYSMMYAIPLTCTRLCC